MKVLLIPSPTVQWERLDIPEVHVPVGLISIATVLHNAGMDVGILDINAIALDSTYSEVPNAIITEDPDVIGFSTMCMCYHITLRLARRCKELKPGVKIIFGGPQATFSDRATLEAFPYVDIIVRGEAEGTIVQVVEALSRGENLQEVPGITFRSSNRIVRTARYPLIRNLDDLPDPMYDLLPSMRLAKKIFIETGRGCPFKCSFCCTNKFWSRTFRVRSIDLVIGLIKKLVIDFGAREFSFLHDTFTISRNRVVQFCEALKREKLDIKWSCSTRTNCLDEDLLHLMAEAGCDNIFLGIESGSERMQKIIGKNLDLSRVLEIVNCIADKGIDYTASFIIGFPSEKLEDVEQTINLAMALRYREGKCQDIQFHRLYPLPMSRLFEEHGTRLLFDGNFCDFAASNLCAEDFKMVRKYPEVFSAYHYYPTKCINRAFVLRIHFFMENLLYMLPYTGFIFYKDETLRFPRCIIEYHSLLELPPNFQSEFGKSDNLTLLCKFLNSIFHRLGIEEHPVREVMRYELAVKKVRDSEKGETHMEFEEFDYDVERFIKEVDANGFQKLPEFISGKGYALLFTKKDDKVVTARLPVKLAQMLSPRLKSQEFV